MGYSTDFSGSFSVEPPIDDALADYLERFASSRRMARDPEAVKRADPDWADHCFHGELGPQAAYYVSPGSELDPWSGSKEDSVLDHNRPPEGQPGLWCQWVPNADGGLEWDQGEKFYNYVEWLSYLIDNFIAPTGRTVSGEVRWRGEEFDDIGTIRGEDNVVDVDYAWS